jgi:hypothetical protein
MYGLTEKIYNGSKQLENLDGKYSFYPSSIVKKVKDRYKNLPLTS